MCGDTLAMTLGYDMGGCMWHYLSFKPDFQAWVDIVDENFGLPLNIRCKLLKI